MPFTLEGGKEIDLKSANVKKRNEAMSRKTLVVVTSDDRALRIDFLKTNERWFRAGSVMHGFLKKCPYCGTESKLYCKAFKSCEDEFLKFVLAHPKIRIKAALQLKPLRL